MSEQSASPVVLVERKEYIATVTFNRPESMNALTPELIQALTETLQLLDDDPDARAIVLTGAGRAF